MSLDGLPEGPAAGAVVVLTVAHRHHVPEQRGEDQVVAMCQGCHLHHDIEHHRRTRQRTRAAELAAQHRPLFPLGAPAEDREGGQR